MLPPTQGVVDIRPGVDWVGANLFYQLISGRYERVPWSSRWHQPLGLMSPWTNLHAYRGWKLKQPFVPCS